VKVISDSGPLLSFARAGRLEILRQVLGEIMIPEAVFEEITVYGKGRPGAAEVETGTWIKREKVQNRPLLNQFSKKLNLGEMEALALAQEMDAILLVDEYEARRAAQRLGIKHFGSLRILKAAKDRGIISEIKPVLDELIISGTYISDSLYQEFLRAVGEEDQPSTE
jgi:predicted nucleic acid-binding protein